MSKLTDDEKHVLREAIRIAREDGSIYGAHEEDEKIDALLESAIRKLKLPS